MWRGAKRRFRRLRYRLQPGASFVHDATGITMPSGVPLDPRRARKILAFLVEEGLVVPGRVSPVVPASIANVRRVHTDRYLDSLTDPEVLRGIFGVPVESGEVDTILDVNRRMVGGTIQATRLALKTDQTAVHLGGGFHHATPDRGMGFCMFNDVGVAIRRLRARGFQAPILIVDLDVHDGNGTRVIFADDPSVFTFSIHNAAWDDAPAHASVSIALGSDVEDRAYLTTLRTELPSVVERHAPGLVIYLAGTDPAFDDQIGDWRITVEGMLTRDQFVIDTVRHMAPQAATAVVMGGGYGPNAWRYSARFFSWLISGEALEPRETGDNIFHRVSRLVPMLRDPELTRDLGDDGGWGLSASDLPGFGAAEIETRVLDHYTSHGIELVLDRTGILAALRDRGFPAPSVEVMGGGGVPPTVRVFGDADRTQLVVEFRVVRNQAIIPGEDVLFVEWLLLQNPAAEFDDRRPRLPGQEHPGLGLLGPVAGLLVAMADALQLSGVAFMPANYYIAVLSQNHLRFVDPVAQARFEALHQALGGLSLSQASRALEEGRVRDTQTNLPERWEPSPMVMPGKVMRQRLDSPEYQAALDAARGRYHFTVADSAS
jgi:acetoin utilization deacetylase AcuC-like enzyme